MADQVGGARILSAIKSATDRVEAAPDDAAVDGALDDLLETVGRTSHMTCGHPGGTWRECPVCSKALSDGAEVGS